MDKKIFLIDKDFYTEEMVAKLTEKDLEEWVAEEDYTGDCTIVKIDANRYNTAKDAIKNEFPFCNLSDFYVFTFGF